MKNNNVFKIVTLGIILVTFASCQKQPEAMFTMSSSSIYEGETVYFTNSSLDGYSYLWSFSDGNFSYEYSPSHTFNTAGTYEVSLTTYSKKGKYSDTYTETLTVETKQTTDLVITVYNIDGMLPVSDCQIKLFTNQSDWDNFENVIDFGNTDNKGEITFTDLQPIKYYVDAYRVGYTGSGYYSNWNLDYITDPLIENLINYYTVYVEYSVKKDNNKIYKVVGVKPVFPGKKEEEKNLQQNRVKN